METRAERLLNVINDALTSTVRADQLRTTVLAAQQSSVGSQPWIDLVTLFARNEQELTELSTLSAAGGGTFLCCTVPTSYLLNTVSTVACTTTTTNTTTSYFCPGKGESAQGKSQKKVIGKKRQKVR